MSNFTQDKISKTSPEFFKYVIETLPVSPTQASLFFEIAGLSSLERGEYYPACIEKRVIPHSSFQLNYGEDGRCVAREPKFEICGVDAAENLIGGSRFSRISVKIDPANRGAFQSFRENKFPVIQRARYGLESADLWLSSRYLGDEGGHIKTSGIYLGNERTSVQGVELLLPENVGIPVEERRKILNWWKKLKSLPILQHQSWDRIQQQGKYRISDFSADKLSFHEGLIRH